jgi:hypothetical protein
MIQFFLQTSERLKEENTIETKKKIGRDPY